MPSRRESRTFYQARARRISDMLVEGATVDEVAAAFRIAKKTLYRLRSRWGFPLFQKPGHRRLFAVLRDADVEALDGLAEDLGRSRAEALGALLGILLSDGAHGARQSLRHSLRGKAMTAGTPRTEGEH